MSEPIITPTVIALTAGSVLVGLLGLYLVVSALLARCPPGYALLLSGGPGWRRFRVVSQGRTVRLPLLEAADVIDARPLAVDLPLPGGSARLRGTVRMPVVGDAAETAARLVYALPRPELERLVHTILTGAAHALPREQLTGGPPQAVAQKVCELGELGRFGLTGDDLRVE